MGSGYTVIGSQYILPALAVVVAIGNCADSGSYRAGGIGIFLFREDISTRIIGIHPRLSCRLIVLLRQLVQSVVGVAGGSLDIGIFGFSDNRQDVAPVIICIVVRHIIVNCLIPPGTDLRRGIGAVRIRIGRCARDLYL